MNDSLQFQDDKIGPPNMNIKTLINTFFPRWRTQQEWRIITGYAPYGRSGFCDLGKRRIYVSQSLNDISGQVIAIHEIVHVVSVPHHGVRFKLRLAKCAEVAEQLKLNDLAVALRKEVASYSDERKERYSQATIRKMIEDVLFQSVVSWKVMLPILCQTLRLSPCEIYTRCKNVREFFERLRKQFIAINKQRQFLLQRAEKRKAERLANRNDPTSASALD